MSVLNVYYTTIKKVVRIGKSLSIILPTKVADILLINGNTIFYAYVVGNKIVYSLDKPSDKKFMEIKPRVQARYGDREYYAITIPAVYARVVGITEGSLVLVKCFDRMFVIEKHGFGS